MADMLMNIAEAINQVEACLAIRDNAIYLFGCSSFSNLSF
jgi:hypothetical protein